MLQTFVNLYFCQLQPDLLMKHKKLPLIWSVHRPPKPLHDFLPVKAGIKANHIVSMNSDTGEVTKRWDFSSYEVRLITTSDKWKQKSFLLRELLIFIRSDFKRWVVLGHSLIYTSIHVRWLISVEDIIWSFRKHSDARKLDLAIPEKGKDLTAV